MLKVGVVGVGMMGRHHVRVYSKLGCELVGIADVNEGMRSLADKYNTKFYTDYKKLVNKVEAASIAVPTSLHKEVALHFINAGTHCLIEKPIAAKLKEAKELIKAADKKRVKLLIGHIERFNPAVTRLKEIIDKGALGKLIMISTRRVGPFVSRIRDVGIIVDSATHDIDVIRYLVGKEPESVFAKFGKFKHEKEDNAIVVLDFGNITAAIEVNWFTPHKVRSLVVTGSKGIAYLDYLEQKVEVYNSERKIVLRVDKEEPLKLELRHFLECIEKDKEPLVNGYEGLKVLEIALRASKA